MAITFKVTGIDQMLRKMQGVSAKFPGEAERALHQETEIEATECKRRTPVDTGALRSSIHVEGPDRHGRSISTAIVAGGPAAAYAVQVHEDLEAFHPVGQSKFIESVLRESVPHLADRIARRIDLSKMVG